MRYPSITAAALTAAILAGPAYAESPSNEELYEIIKEQQRELEELKEDKSKSQGTESSKWDKLHIGGYGELHYNNFDRNTKDDQIDFHRFILYVGYDFNEDVRFFSELELEHALAEDTATGDGPGELELEQAWIEFDLGERHAARAGLDLIPVGILNITHEPPTFYGVERNRVESAIIPTTWWAGGAKLIGRPGETGFSYELFVHEGIEVAADPAFSIRSGRQKTAKANANELAATGQVKYTGMPGLELASSVQYQSDVTQDRNDGLEEAWLYSAHAIYSSGPFGLRALYAQWDFNGSIAENNDREDQFGWYVEPSFKVHPKVGVFARYAELEETEDATEENTTVGVNYWPVDQVVLKADYQQREFDTGAPDDDSFNLGVGYAFP